MIRSFLSLPSTLGFGRRREASTPSRNFEEISSIDPSYDCYKRHLSAKGHGIPIWIPEPNENLNASYRKQGVSIGDVICFTQAPDGALDFLFNICLPAEHEINSNGVPEPFIPFNLNLQRDTRRYQQWPDGHHIASESITQKKTSLHPTHSRSNTSTRNPFPSQSLHADQATNALGSPSNHGANISDRRAEVSFISSASEGAILTMPEGAYAEELTGRSQFHSYLSDNLASWYKYANEDRGWDVKMGDLHLVTGVHKAKAWGIATFKFAEEATEVNVNLQLKAEVTQPYGRIYSWECSGINDSPRTGPTTTQRESLFRNLPEEERGKSFENQCLFVRTLNAAIQNSQRTKDSLADGITNQVDNPAHSDISRTPGGHVGSSQISSAIETGETHVRIPGGWNASIVQNGPVLRDHPSKAINDFLLKEKPNGRIAITHDEHWISLLTESDVVIPTADEFLARLTKSYRIIEDQGIISLEDMSDVESEHEQSSKQLKNLPTRPLEMLRFFNPVNPVITLSPMMLQPTMQGIIPNIFDINGTSTLATKSRRSLQILFDNIAHGAFYNSSERGDPPRCHPRTRLAILAEIMEWIKAPRTMRKLILWLYGPAGSGKTAIAQSIAEKCAQSGLLSASFFFGRTAIGRNNASRFVATLAYQLSRHLPQMEELLITAIKEDPTIFSRSLSTQMRVLVVDPLKVAAASLSMPIFTIVDGFDECGPTGQSQAQLLHLLCSVASELQHIPFIFLISSRPEYKIREAFNSDVLSSLTKVLVLDNTYKPDEDIKLYFDSAFRNIYEEHRRLRLHFPSPWPTASDVDFLVSKASGQFIFAATVIKFINSINDNPAHQMDILLAQLTNGKETPFMQLDGLFRFVLDSAAEIANVLKFLKLLFLAGDYKKHLTLEDAEEILGFSVHKALIDMHSLVFVPPLSENKIPQIHHASLFDFLQVRSRSQGYYIDPIQGHIDLCRCWLRLLGTHRRSPTIRTDVVVDAFVFHCCNCPVGEIVDDLAGLELRSYLEGISNFQRDLYCSKWDEFFGCVKKQTKGRNDVFLRLRNDFDAFIKLHRDATRAAEPTTSFQPLT